MHTLNEENGDLVHDEPAEESGVTAQNIHASQENKTDVNLGIYLKQSLLKMEDKLYEDRGQWQPYYYAVDPLIDKLFRYEKYGLIKILQIGVEKFGNLRLPKDVYSQILTLYGTERTRLEKMEYTYRLIYTMLVNDSSVKLDPLDIYNVISILKMLNNEKYDLETVFLQSINSDPAVRKEIMVYKVVMSAFLSTSQPAKALSVWNIMVKEVMAVKSDHDAMALYIKAVAQSQDICQCLSIIEEYESNIPMHKRSKLIYEIIIANLYKTENDVKDAEELLQRLQTRKPYIHGLRFCGNYNVVPTEIDFELANNVPYRGILVNPTTSPTPRKYVLPRPKLFKNDVYGACAVQNDYNVELIGPFVGLESYLALCDVYMHNDMFQSAKLILHSVFKQLLPLHYNIIFSIRFISTYVKVLFYTKELKDVLEVIVDFNTYINNDTIKTLEKEVNSLLERQSDSGFDREELELLEAIKNAISLLIFERKIYSYNKKASSK